MAVDREPYVMTGTTKMIYNPSYDDLFKEELVPSLE